MVECDIEVDDIPVDENPFIWDTVADDFVQRRA